MIARRALLLLLLLGFGGAIETAWALRGHVSYGPFGIRVLGGRFYGPSHTFSEQREEALAEGVPVVITNAFGAVRVHEGAPGRLAITLSKVVYADREARARELADGLHLVIERGAEGVRLATNREQLEGGLGFETHFELAVPPGTPVAVRNEHGPVALSGVGRADVNNAFDEVRLERVSGESKVECSHGDVTASTLGGPLAVTLRHGNLHLDQLGAAATVDVEHGDVEARGVRDLSAKLAFGDLKAEQVQGVLGVEGQHAAVDATDVRGRTRVSTSFDDVDLSGLGAEAEVTVDHGAVTVRRVAGSLSVKSSYDDVTLEDVAGAVDLTVDHGGVKARKLGAGGILRASGNDITVEGFRGPLEVIGERAAVLLDPGSPVADPITATTSHADLTLRVPEGSRFDLEAQAGGGELSAEAPGLTVTGRETGRLAARAGAGGVPVRLRTEQGDVRVGPPAAGGRR